MSLFTEDDILHSLLQGDWLFSNLIPSFRSKLEQVLFVKDGQVRTNWSLFLLTSLVYRKENLSTDLIVQFSDPAKKSVAERLPSFTNSSENAFWKNALEIVQPGTSPSAVSDTDLKELEHAVDLLNQYSLMKSQSNLSNWVDVFVPFDSNDFRSASHPHYFGCIFLRLNRPAVETTLSLVHELGHQELFLLNLIDRLIPTEGDYHMVHAPFQGRQRPPIGRLHSAHALFRMGEYEHAVNDSCFERHLETLEKTIDTFEEHDLTKFGRKLVYDVYQIQVNRYRGRS